MAAEENEKRKKELEERLKDHEKALKKHDERLAILESSSVLESKRLDSLCEQLMEFSFDIKEMLSSHDERMKEQEMECVKKKKILKAWQLRLKESCQFSDGLLRQYSCCLQAFLSGTFKYCLFSLKRSE